jgi:1-aminocyclopropane-1-carboxylate deaminase/D-cysteine desulfhydrase-like pyridoxal-dependent ACC family enzyme|tara:strand:+ start:116 stop:700 length:585 start_codon:yes stop_codon:yes gene_type:complete
MATKKEELQKKIKAQENLKATFVKKGNTKFADKIEAKIQVHKKELETIEINESAKEADKKADKKPKQSKTIASGMTKEACIEFLKGKKNMYLKSEDTTKKNIKSGRAIEDGTLKASASLKNEAETIENKSDSGQTITKKEQKAIAFNIESIVKNCVEMIKYKKDADQLIKDLIKKLGEIRADIATGRLKPGAQN